MIAKIIAYGRDRDEALARLRRAMAETTVIIEGGATNKSFVLDLLDQPEVIDASADTGWIDRVRAEGRLVSHRHSGVALAAAAIEAYEDEEEVERQRLLSTAHGGRPQVQHESGRPLDLKLRGVGYRRHRRPRRRRPVPRRHRGRRRRRCTARRRRARALRRATRGRIRVNGQRFRLVTGHARPDPPGRGRRRHPPRQPRRGRRRPLPRTRAGGRDAAAVGDEVEAGAPMLVLESMKMETVLRAPFRGPRQRVAGVGRQPGRDRRAAAAPGAARRRRRGDGRRGDRGRRARPARRARRTRPRPTRAERGLAGPAQPAARLRRRPAATRAASWPTTSRARTELRRPAAARGRAGRCSTVFADLSRAQPQPAGRRGHRPNGGCTARASTSTSTCRASTPSAPALPETFQARLTRVLRTTASPSWTARPELEEAVFRIFLAQQRTGRRRRRRHRAAAAVARRGAAGESLRERAGQVLEHLVAATQLRFPAVGDLARGVRVPLVRPAAAAPRPRRGATPASATELRLPRPHPDAPDRAERIAGAWSPARSRSCGCWASGSAGAARPRAAAGGADPPATTATTGCPTCAARDVGRPLVRRRLRARRQAAAAAGHHGRRLRRTAPDAAARARRRSPRGAGRPRRRRHLPALGGPAGRRRDGRAELRRAAGRARRCRRACAGSRSTVAGHRRRGDAPPLHVPAVDGAGLTEDRLIRGLHPHDRRSGCSCGGCTNFDLTRLPSRRRGRLPLPVRRAGEPGRRAAGRAGPGPRPDAAARRTTAGWSRCPRAEDAVAACLDAIRSVQAQRPPTKRFDTNRILMYVWPPIELTADELTALRPAHPAD